MKSTSRTRPRKLELTLMAAIATIAVMALPSLATAHGHRHHRHARHLSGWISETVPNQAATPTTGNTPATGQDNAGTIASFDGTTLKITLNDGSTLAGQVTSSTEIECPQSTTQQGTSDGQQGDSGEASDNPSQPGSQTESQDQGGQSGEQSDSQDQSGGDQSEGDGSGSCTTAALVPGAIVHEAELEIGPNGAVFHSIHLAG